MAGQLLFKLSAFEGQKKNSTEVEKGPNAMNIHSHLAITFGEGFRIIYGVRIPSTNYYNGHTTRNFQIVFLSNT
jgi:hypothetical protein